MGGRVTFHDSYWYCYSNSTAMLLSSIDEAVSPRLLEAVSGVGLGAFISTDGLPFFSGLKSEPDEGISRALRLLGFAALETAFEKPESTAAFEQLRSNLKVGPVLLGPLDMVHLTYNPTRPNFSGVDHFVLVFGVKGDQFVLHDPAGFGDVLISEADLEKAWRADAIEYKRGHFRSWCRPRRVSTRSQGDVFGDAVAAFKNLYADARTEAAASGRLHDEAAISEMVAWMTNGTLSPAQRGHLTRFALPLGVKRALDYADFFEIGHSSSLASAKREQASAFGRCLSHLVSERAAEAISELHNLAAFEARIRNEILGL